MWHFLIKIIHISGTFYEFKFLKLEFHVILKFQKCGRLLHILKTMVDCKIFWPKMVFGHSGQGWSWNFELGTY